MRPEDMHDNDINYQPPEALRAMLDRDPVWSAGCNSGQRIGFAHGFRCGALTAVIAIIILIPLVVWSRGCESRALGGGDGSEIVVELAFVDIKTGQPWFTDGDDWYTIKGEEWYISETPDLAGANPLGRGRRVRVHGNG